MKKFNLELNQIFKKNKIQLEKSKGKSPGSPINTDKIFLSTLHAKKISNFIGDGFNSGEYKNAFVSISNEAKTKICNNVIYSRRYEYGEEISVSIISNKNVCKILGKGSIGSVELWNGSESDLIEFFR